MRPSMVGLTAALLLVCGVMHHPSHLTRPAATRLVPMDLTAGMLNNVIEIWRYPSAQACHDARKAARAVPEWRETIAAVTPGVQHFTSSFMHAVPFSPMQ